MAVASDQERLHQLSARLTRLVHAPRERSLLTETVRALDLHDAVTAKVAKEPDVEQIVAQMIGRLVNAFGSLSGLRGKKILDIACGSNTSKAPGVGGLGYTAQFEPWMCRILHGLGADPVGVDLGDLEREAFAHYRVDLGKSGSLDFLPGHSFDAVQDSRLFGSPEFTARFPDYEDHLRIAQEIVRQERRVLKPGGIIIYSDAQDVA